MTDFRFQPMDAAPQRQTIALLSDPATFRHNADNPAVMETNQSYVFLWGRYAYKLFKAIDSGIRDNTSLPARLENAQLEMEANQALAADLYLGILPIVLKKDGGLALGKPSDKRPAVDYVVRMRRFDAADMFYTRLFNGTLTRKHVFDLCHKVGAFHRHQPPATLKDVTGAKAFEADLMSVFARAEVLVEAKFITRERFGQLRNAAAKAVRRREVALNRRSLQAYRILHGDMDFGNIVLWKGAPVPFDAAVLNPRMRHNDVMRDLSYILAPLFLANQPDLVKYALDGYLASTGDNEGMRILHLWVGYAAMVRGRSWLYRAYTGTTLTQADRDELTQLGLAYLDVADKAFAGTLYAFSPK
jgi:aminoglycoside phosphotransferase family enzyme